MNAYSDLMLAVFFLSLRFGPLFTFAPPFTLMRIPVTIRVLLALSLALWVALSFPEQTSARISQFSIFDLAVSELAMGVAFALSLQWAFAAIYTIGRSLDVQAGFAMAMLADPANQSQLPLLGTVLGYGAAVVFFGIGGAADMLAIFVESVIRIPMGDANLFINPAPLVSFIAIAFVAAVGLVGLVMLVLFMIDMTVAYLSRTLPQMNVLLVGFQVKTLAILAVTPIALSLSLAAYLRLIRGALNTTSVLILGS